MLKKAAKNIIILSLLVLYVGCSEFRKIQKSDDWKLKYDAALKYYERKDYYRSVILFDQIRPYLRGTAEAEQVEFYYAYAHYYHFQKDYPDSRLNENISFYKIECSYKLAKNSIRSRQRERLMETVQFYEFFIDTYLSSENIRDAENIFVDILDDLEKLAKNNL